MRSVESIVEAYITRRNKTASERATGELLRRVYYGEHISSLPELDRAERAQVANLIQTGVDQHAMRIASVMPVIQSPALKNTRSAKRLAWNRKQTIAAWSNKNHMPLVTRHRARHLIALGSSPVLVKPGLDEFPCWEIQDPLYTYAAPTKTGDMVPSDTIVAVRRTYGMLQAQGYNLAGLSRPRDTKAEQLFTVLNYVDADEHVLVCMGQQDYAQNSPDITNIELVRTPNKVGMPLVVIPGRIALDKVQGQFDQMIGMYEEESEIWALQKEAIKRAIFPEAWIYGQDPDITQVADPIEGTVGRITGGQIELFRTDASQMAFAAGDRLERAQRLTGAVPAEFGGEAPSNVRTARRGGQVFSAVVDFPVQEHQELLAASMEKEYEIAIAVAKAYWGNTSKTFQIPYARGPVTYTPNDTFEDGACVYVQYSYAGSDTNGLVIEAGQRIGMGTLSKQSFMEIDPLVNDPDAEGDRIVLEGIQQAVVASIQQQAADPNGPWQPQQLARLAELVGVQNVDLYEAVQKVHEEAQQAQAQMQQGQMSPEQMQPGLSQAGAPGTPQAGQAIPGPTNDQQNLMFLLNNLHRTGQSPVPAGAPGG